MGLQKICLSILLTTVVLSFVRALPVEDVQRAPVELPNDTHDEADKSNDVDHYGNDSEVEHTPPLFEKIPKEMGCKVLVTKTYNRTKEVYDYETHELKVIRDEVNITAEDCCEGWGGTECDERKPVDSPCGNLTCQSYPHARCALIKRCGIDIPLFVDDMGRVLKDCLPDEHLCMGICKTDPCKDQLCERYPEAMCFTSACSCDPVWLLPTKIRVSNCSLEDREVREAGDEPRCQSS